MSGKSEWVGIDGVIAALANEQHGVVARRELLAVGVAAHAIEYRLRERRLHRIHHGVYAVGHRTLTREARWLAAVLAAGPVAVLSHRAAAALHGIRPFDGLEVTVPAYRARRGITVYTSSLPKDEITTVSGIPVTGSSRTLLDLAAVLRPYQLERAINEAEVRRLHDALALPDLIARYPRRKGVAAINAILERDVAFTRSDLEAFGRQFIREQRLPPARHNFVVLGDECDCVWSDQRLILKVDGRATHDTAAAFERDRERDRILGAAGWHVVRVTWRQLHERPEAIAADLRTMLAAAPRPRGRARAAGP